MDKTNQNTNFYLKYHTAVSGKVKTRELISQYIEDEKLIQHILFFESIFPKYQMMIDDLVAAGEKIFVRAHMVGLHEGVAEGIPATHQVINTPFAVGYTIRNEKIVDFWAIANELEFLEQLGLAKEQINVPKRDEIKPGATVN